MAVNLVAKFGRSATDQIHHAEPLLKFSSVNPKRKARFPGPHQNFYPTHHPALPIRGRRGLVELFTRKFLDRFSLTSKIKSVPD